MKYLAAYALLVMGGKENPTYEDVAKMLKEVGVAVDKEQLISMMDKLADKDFNTLINEGQTKLANMAPAQTRTASTTVVENVEKVEQKE